MKGIAISAVLLAAASFAAASPVRIDVVAGEPLTAVRDKVRRIPAAEKMDGVEVVLAPGEYLLPDGLVFSAADGGVSADAPVVWRAAMPGTVKISGAVRVPPSSFAKVADSALLSRLPEEGRGKVYAADISSFISGGIPPFAIEGKSGIGYLPKPPFVFLGGRLGVLAQWPNDTGEWLVFSNRVDRGIPPSWTGQGFAGGAFIFSDPRMKRWDFSKEVWLSGYFTHDWATWAAPAVSWGVENGTNNVVRFRTDYRIPFGTMGGTWGRKERRFRAFNLFEELDTPGEWWIDRGKKMLYVVPPGGAMTDDTDIRISFSGNSMMSGRGVANMRFEGIAFRANYGMLAELWECDGIEFSECAFSCCVQTAVVLNGCRNRVTGCELRELGSAGISISGGDRKSLTPSGSAVENCRIRDFGILQRTYAGGVRMDGCGLALKSCEIFNSPHTAVFYHCNDSVLESNDIHHVLLETGDAGAIYTGRDWTTQGNVLRYNYMHDIGKGTTSKEGADAAVSGTNAMGMYFDDCDCGDEVLNNVFENCPRGILIGGGRDHPVRGNVFLNCRLGLSIDCRGWRWKNWNTKGDGWNLEERAQKFDYTSGVWAARYPRLADIMNDNPREPLYNPVENNTFVNCGEIIKIDEVFKLDADGTAPGIASRMAPIRNNVVINTDPGRPAKINPHVAPGFRILSPPVLQAAPWIGDGLPVPEGAEWFADRPAPEFRTWFSLLPGQTSAVLRVAAAGYCDVHVNGRRLSETSVMPLWSPYDHTIYADEFKLDDMVPWPGTNAVTIALGNGFRNLPPMRFWGGITFRDAMASGTPAFKASVGDIPLAGWQWRDTGILRNCVYLGAHVDATRAAGEWRPASEVDGPKGRIVPRKAPPIAQIGRLRGNAKWLEKGRVQIVDFGENATGVPEFRFRGTRPGRKVEIVYGERLNADGSVNALTQAAGQIKPKEGIDYGEGCPCPAVQRDVYVCSGKGDVEAFSPPFVWHVCRYAEVRGDIGLLGEGDATFLKLASDVRDTALAASFRAVDSDLQRIHEMCRRTFLANLMGVQSDCPGRERLGYGGDIVSTCDAYCLNWDMREFYLKTLQDFADEAADDGWITETAPYAGIAACGFGGRSGPVSWALAVPVLMDALLRHYGDGRALEFYPVCARYARLVAEKRPDGTVQRCIGDHEALERAPDDMVATAHWHEFLKLTAGFAGRLGRVEDEAEFRALAEKTAAAFAAKWVKDDGTVANGTQSAQAIAFYLGLVPGHLREAAFSKLIEAVEARGFAPTTGIFSTRYMLMALSEGGRADIARRIVLHRGFSGWLHMLEKGATTLWETWEESDDVYSNCHPMFGSVDEWILRHAREARIAEGDR